MRVSDETARRFAWQQRALCAEREVPPDAFFPERRPQAGLKELCFECPVQAECLAFAMETGAVGIWGGTTDNERRKGGRLAAMLPDRSSIETIEHWLAS